VKTNDRLPLVRIGQGTSRKDIYPKDIAKPKTTIDFRFLIREPADVYHAKSKDYLTAHALADFRHCPLFYRQKQLGLIPDHDSTFYLVGRAAHTLILEGRERYGREFAVGGPINPKTGQPFGSKTKAFAEWAAQQSKTVLSDDHAALVEQMAAAVKGHDLARELLADGTAEGVVRGEYEGHACQARIDWISADPDHGIVDLKTADTLDNFEISASTFGYMHQLAFYRALVARVSGRVVPVHLITVEKREPYRCGVWQIRSAVLDAVQEQNENALRELEQCKRNDHWPTRYEALRMIDSL
jgi:hypothetical protein